MALMACTGLHLAWRKTWSNRNCRRPATLSVNGHSACRSPPQYRNPHPLPALLLFFSTTFSLWPRPYPSVLGSHDACSRHYCRRWPPPHSRLLCFFLRRWHPPRHYSRSHLPDPGRLLQSSLEASCRRVQRVSAPPPPFPCEVMRLDGPSILTHPYPPTPPFSSHTAQHRGLPLSCLP